MSILARDLSQRDRGLVKVNTAGCVDNGKSTLIGKLLFETGSLRRDEIDRIQIASSASNSGATGSSNLNLAFVSDGLAAERERGITIDVAYKYASLPKFDLVLADTPGHEEFTRNMVTGTANSDLTLILVDATKGIVPQNRRHAYIAGLLGVENLAVLVNKIDLVGFSEDAFNALKLEFSELLKGTGIKPHFIPISAYLGDNVISTSSNTSWYSGPSVLGLIEEVAKTNGASKASQHSQIRYVLQLIRQAQEADKIEALGKLDSGTVYQGEQLRVLRTGELVEVNSLSDLHGELASASFPGFLRSTFTAGADLKRGDVLHMPEVPLQIATAVQAEICWLDANVAGKRGQKLILQQGSIFAEAEVDKIIAVVDMDNYQLDEVKNSARLVQQNDIALVGLGLKSEISLQNFRLDKISGRFSLIDPESGSTVAAGVVKRILA